MKRKWETRARLSNDKLAELKDDGLCPICGAVEPRDNRDRPKLGREFVELGRLKICYQCSAAIDLLGNGNSDYLLAVAALLKIAFEDYTMDIKPFPDIKDKYDSIDEFIKSPDYRDENVQAMRTAKEYRELPSPSGNL